MPDWIDHVQWPAMAITILASYLVGSEAKARRNAAFWVFLLSNILWTAWGLYSHAYALVALQVALAVMNTRGMKKTDDA